MGYLHINILAVLVSAVVTFGIGALWYSPFLFGKQWMAFNDVTPDKVEAMRKGAARLYGISFLCYVVLAAVFAILIRMVHLESVLGGAKMGGMLWVGFVATLGLTASLYQAKPLKAFALDAGYQLVFMVVMGLILTAWH
jgi:hypothetical protein